MGMITNFNLGNNTKRHANSENFFKSNPPGSTKYLSKPTS